MMALTWLYGLMATSPVSSGRSAPQHFPSKVLGKHNTPLTTSDERFVVGAQALSHHSSFQVKSWAWIKC